MTSSQTPHLSNFVSVASVVRPWTPQGDFTIHEALDYFGRWHFGEEWTGTELGSKATDLRPFDAPYGVIEPRANASSASEEREARNVRIVAAKHSELDEWLAIGIIRPNPSQLMTRTEADAWLADLIPQLRNAWDEKRAARVRYEKAVGLMRQIMFDQGISATVLTQHGHRVAVPTSVWGHAAAPNVFATGRASFSNGDLYFPDQIEGQVLISRKSLDAFIDQVRRLNQPPAAEQVDGTDPTDAQEGASAVSDAAAVAEPVAATEAPVVPEAAVAPAAATTPRPRNGRTPVYDWDKMWVELFAHFYESGRPAAQAELVRIALDWFMREIGRQPTESEVKKRVSMIYSRIRAADN